MNVENILQHTSPHKINVFWFCVDQRVSDPGHNGGEGQDKEETAEGNDEGIAIQNQPELQAVQCVRVLWRKH